MSKISYRDFSRSIWLNDLEQNCFALLEYLRTSGTPDDASTVVALRQILQSIHFKMDEFITGFASEALPF